jgi:probable HAF family extracellular repeat protein
MNDLGTLGGPKSVGTGINDDGLIVGTSEAVGTSHAFLYKNGIMSDLNTLLSSSISQATDINKSGQVVGGADFGLTGSEEYMHAFIFDTKTNNFQDIGTLPGRERSVAMSINDKGQVVGGSRHAGVGDSHPFLFEKNKMIDLTPNSVGTAWGINNLGQVVGSTSPDGAFIYTKGQVHYLNYSGLAYSINDAGQIVGSLGSFGAWTWTKQTGVQDLNTLIPSNSGWELTGANGINQQGEIAGIGIYQGHAHGYLLVDPNKPGLPNQLNIDEEAYIMILFGVTKDGGGLGITPGGKPKPIDPWGPLREKMQNAGYSKNVKQE